VRFIWTDAGDDPTWENGDKAGINGYFCPLFDPITPAVLDEAIARGHAHGAYLGHNWYPNLTAVQLAAKVSAEFKRLVVRRPKLRVMLNLEEHDPPFVLAVLRAWRALHPYVSTSWSCEGMQGGWMDPAFVAGVLGCRVRVVPQCFSGNMTRFESDAVLRDLMRRGFPENIVSPFYDAAALGLSWDGFAFTAGRLPAA
jgi:hypothetical protein